MSINPDLYLRNRIHDEKAREFLLKVLGKEEALKLIRGTDVLVVHDDFIELWETNCYVHVDVRYGRYEIVDEEKGTCQDGPDVWRVYKEKYRIYPPAIIRHYKTPDRVYDGWEKIIILLPKTQQ